MKSKVTLLIGFFSIFSQLLNSQDFNNMVDGLLQHSVPLCSADSLNQIMLEGGDIYILDARERNEYEVSHLLNAVWVGYDNFDAQNIAIPKDGEIIVYCSVGYRSEKVAAKLAESGYRQVRNLYGGIFGWKNIGYPVYDSTNRRTEKVHAYNKDWSKWLTGGIKVLNE